MSTNTTAAQAGQDDITARLRENADLDAAEDGNPAVIRMEREAADEIDRLRALLSKLRAPVASAEVMDALNWVDDFIARCNRDDRGSCESVNVLRRALASAPVADEPAFYINPMIIDAETGKIARDVSRAITWDSKEGRAWSLPVYLTPRPASVPVAGEAQAVALVEVSVPHLRSISVKLIPAASMPNVGDLLYAVPQASEAAAAVRTLTRRGYTWQGGKEWKPPLGDSRATMARLDASEAVRDAALEEAAGLVGGHCWSYARSDVSELIARHIRALKSLSAQPGAQKDSQ
ncbi:hypothetical protein LMG26857_01308 [Achromobacter anxifer]|uniref:hypothetical protein n=1 Tax=Achromobacter anxifer TaxID=1287737 RepID=UPI00155D3FBC|nr:hypothetical protein [Achromobacter anxifer]CAB5512019.1 hypothetical protein LMG26857_01308 [Achromobacter anxifer]